MRTRSLLLLLALPACSGTSTSSTTGDGGTATMPDQSSGGRCTGTAVEPRRMTDITSCQIQKGDWDSTYQECDSKVGKQSCADFDTSAAAYGVDFGKRGCIEMLGCAWTNDDGTVEKNAYVGGQCFGTVAPCSTLEQTRCNEQLGCKYTTVAPAGCKPTNSRNPLDNYTECGNYTPTPDPSAARAHPIALHGSCLRKIGCSFRLADGTVEAGKE